MGLALGALAACRSSCGNEPAPARASNTAASNQFVEPVTILQLHKSAYQARLDLTPDAIYLLTMDAAYRLAAGAAPEESKLDLSDIGVATPTSFIFWSNGAFWLAPKRGGAPGRLGDVKARPIYIVSVDERFAWIGPDGQGRHAVYDLHRGEPRLIHTLSGQAAAATMVDDLVVFLERVDNGSWRLGSVPRTGGTASFGTTRKGRHPAMLAAAGDIYYYYWDDKGTSEVRAASPDLRQERAVASNLTCSPLTVADRIYCVSMEGVFEISLPNGLPKLVSLGDAASITTIAADGNRIVWVRDAGPEKLEVKVLDRTR